MVNIKTYFFYIGLLCCLLTFFGCGGDGSHSTDSNVGAGSIGFGLAWESPDGSSMSKSTAFRAPSIDVCTDYGITTINAYVLNSANSTVTSGSWACSEHGGSHTAVPAGSNYTLRVEAVVSGAVKWRVEVTGISIITGQTTNLGQITMSYIGNDTTPPTVSSTSPANNAISISVNSTVTATFSEKIAPSSLDTTTFTLSNGPNQINGTVSYDQPSMIATFTPISPLSYATTYTATLTTGVKDMAGNNLQSAYTWTFTTGSTPDTTPPTVSSTSPANSATSVAVNSAITVTFSETMTASTVSTATFTLNNGVTGVVTYTGTTATFTPSGNLAYSTTYTATITTGVKDSAGNAMAAAYTWTFTTGSTPDTTPPTVSSTSPANSATSVAVNTAITATFSEAMDAATVTTATFTLNNGVTGTVTYSGTTATFTPASNLAYSTTYTATITTGVKDAAGNAMAAAYTWTFITGTATAATGKMPDTNQTTSYTTTFGEDHDYTINPPSYTDNGDGTITDNVTGLVWQKQDDATTRTWADAGAYCDASTLGGYSDWRLPSQIELISIIDNGVYDPSINTTFFPNTSSSDYWSSTTYAGITSFAWYGIFSSGHLNTSYKTNSNYVRCVRGGLTTPSLTDNGNGTVTDSGTLLTWQQGENSAMTWEAALSYCEGLSLSGQTDWRLPNNKELLSLIDYTRISPFINTTFFPGTGSELFYWSSTTVASDTSYAWVKNFYGYSNGSPDKTYSNYVRCVRGGQ